MMSDSRNRYARRRRREQLSFVAALKNKPCADCGGTFPTECMDFDHVDPSTKSFGISEAAQGSISYERIRAEIQKCQVVCANCHRIRTARQMRGRGAEPSCSDDDTQLSLGDYGVGIAPRHPAIAAGVRGVTES